MNLLNKNNCIWSFFWSVLTQVLIQLLNLKIYNIMEVVLQPDTSVIDDDISQGTTSHDVCDDDIYQSAIALNNNSIFVFTLVCQFSLLGSILKQLRLVWQKHPILFGIATSSYSWIFECMFCLLHYNYHQ